MRTTLIQFLSAQLLCLPNYTPETFLGLLCWGRTRPGTLEKVQISPFRTQARLQNPHSYTCFCYLRALHQVNRDTFLLRSNVKGSAKSSSECDWRPGLQKVLPCPDQQQDGVCWFPTRYRRQLFGECESSKCCCRASKLVQNPRAVIIQDSLALPPQLRCLPTHLRCQLPPLESILHLVLLVPPTRDRSGKRAER